jgi:pimeloyl-ACP methyl ester carboxylesterase
LAESTRYEALHYAVFSNLLVPHPCSQIPSLHFPLNVRDQVPHAYKTTNKIIVLYIIIVVILYSWHEMGVYDLPATIDYILHYTDQTDLYYVGHSMGTTMFYVLMSLKPEYNTKIRHMIALAPVAFLRNTKSLFAVATKFVPKGVSVEF